MIERDMWLVSKLPKRIGLDMAEPVAYYETEAEARAHQAQSRMPLRVQLARITFEDIPADVTYQAPLIPATHDTAALEDQA